MMRMTMTIYLIYSYNTYIHLILFTYKDEYGQTELLSLLVLGAVWPVEESCHCS